MQTWHKQSDDEEYNGFMNTKGYFQAPTATSQVASNPDLLQSLQLPDATLLNSKNTLAKNIGSALRIPML